MVQKKYSHIRQKQLVTLKNFRMTHKFSLEIVPSGQTFSYKSLFTRLTPFATTQQNICEYAKSFLISWKFQKLILEPNDCLNAFVNKFVHLKQEILSSVCLSEGRLDRLIFGFVKKKNKQTTIGQTVQNFNAC